MCIDKVAKLAAMKKGTVIVLLLAGIVISSVEVSAIDSLTRGNWMGSALNWLADAWTWFVCAVMGVALLWGLVKKVIGK